MAGSGGTGSGVISGGGGSGFSGSSTVLRERSYCGPREQIGRENRLGPREQQWICYWVLRYGRGNMRCMKGVYENTDEASTESLPL
eukprot:COSAG01_NODE_2041_length_8568_cov_5.033180_7_plen_86_part_00